MQGMTINHATNTIIVTKAFNEAASEYGTPEYMELNAVKKDNPQMRVVLRSTKAAGRTNDNKGLTYNYMRKFISVPRVIVKSFSIFSLITFFLNTISPKERLQIVLIALSTVDTLQFKDSPICL